MGQKTVLVPNNNYHSFSLVSSLVHVFGNEKERNGIFWETTTHFPETVSETGSISCWLGSSLAKALRAKFIS